MQKILLPFDGSESAKRAVQYVIDFAKAYPAMHVHVLNVQREPNLYGNYMSASMLDNLRASAMSEAQRITAEAARMLEAASVSHETHEAVGEVVGQIGAAVKEHNCTVVVMGTRGMGTLGNLVMGSVATRVVHDVPVPVLLVK